MKNPRCRNATGKIVEMTDHTTSDNLPEHEIFSSILSRGYLDGNSLGVFAVEKKKQGDEE